MPITVEQHPELPAIIVSLSGSQIMQDVPDAIAGLIPVLDAQPTPVFLILSQLGLSISFEDMMHAANMGSKNGPQAAMGHPNVRESLFVTDDGLIKLAAQGMRSVTFGSMNVRVFGTLEDAFEFCRETIAEAAGRDEQG